MITTNSNCELQSGKTFTSADDLRINWAIINVTNSIVGYLNNDFETNIDYNSDTISFSTATISCSDSGFEDFKDGDTIKVSGSLRNDGIYKISTASDSDIILDDTLIRDNSLRSEVEGEDITITVLNLPLGLEQIAINMIIYDCFNRINSSGMQSENIGTYSYNKISIGGIGYPEDIAGGLNNAEWKLLRIN